MFQFHQQVIFIWLGIIPSLLEQLQRMRKHLRSTTFPFLVLAVEDPQIQVLLLLRRRIPLWRVIKRVFWLLLCRGRIRKALALLLVEILQPSADRPRNRFSTTVQTEILPPAIMFFPIWLQFPQIRVEERRRLRLVSLMLNPGPPLPVF